MTQDRNYTRFYALLRQMPRASKEMLVCQYTSGRTESLREMTDAEYGTMLRDLSLMVNDADRLRQARSKALYQLQRYGIDTRHWDEVNRFVSQPRIAGKIFARLSVTELVALTAKMRAIIDKGDRARAQRTACRLCTIASCQSLEKRLS